MSLKAQINQLLNVTILCSRVTRAGLTRNCCGQNPVPGCSVLKGQRERQENLQEATWVEVNTAVKTETAICNSFHVQVASNGIFHFLHRNFNSHFSSDRCATSVLKTHRKSSAIEDCRVLFKLGTCVENPVLLYNYLFKLFLCCWIGHNIPLGFGGRIISCLLFFFGSDIS